MQINNLFVFSLTSENRQGSILGQWCGWHRNKYSKNYSSFTFLALFHIGILMRIWKWCMLMCHYVDIQKENNVKTQGFLSAWKSPQIQTSRLDACTRTSGWFCFWSFLVKLKTLLFLVFFYVETTSSLTKPPEPHVPDIETCHLFKPLFYFQSYFYMYFTLVPSFFIFPSWITDLAVWFTFFKNLFAGYIGRTMLYFNICLQCWRKFHVKTPVHCHFWLVTVKQFHAHGSIGEICTIRIRPKQRKK